MASHEVKFTVPGRPLGKADVVFPVKKGSNKFGTLKASKGGIEWVPADHTYGHPLSWNELAEFALSKSKRKR